MLKHDWNMEGVQAVRKPTWNLMMRFHAGFRRVSNLNNRIVVKSEKQLKCINWNHISVYIFTFASHSHYINNRTVVIPWDHSAQSVAIYWNRTMVNKNKTENITFAYRLENWTPQFLYAIIFVFDQIKNM